MIRDFLRKITPSFKDVPSLTEEEKSKLTTSSEFMRRIKEDAQDKKEPLDELKEASRRDPIVAAGLRAGISHTELCVLLSKAHMEAADMILNKTMLEPPSLRVIDTTPAHKKIRALEDDIKTHTQSCIDMLSKEPADGILYQRELDIYERLLQVMEEAVSKYTPS